MFVHFQEYETFDFKHNTNRINNFENDGFIIIDDYKIVFK